jgi:uncharacterized protein
MSRTTRYFAAVLFSAIAAARGFAQGESPLAKQGDSPFLDGRWEGKAGFHFPVSPADARDAGADPESFALTLFPAGSETESPQGGLVDMPSRGLFGFPLDDVVRDSEGISFALRGKAPFDGLFELKLAPTAEGGNDNGALAGTIRLLSPEGSDGRTVLDEGDFSLVRVDASSRLLEYGIDYPIDTGRGVLPGSLLVPEADSGEAPPLVLILSGSQADRDGNNYAVPGRSDSLLQLALSLRGRGVASLRFDKRGTGEAYALVGDEGKLRFDDHIDDARAALRALGNDLRFSSITVVGFAEGALVGAAALEGTEKSDDRAKVPIAGIVALCASGKTDVEVVEESLASAPQELKGEAEAIMTALKSGKGYTDPSPYFADFFRPSVQPYLSSLFARDIRAAFASAAGRCAALVVAGGSDLQISSAESELLASSADVPYRVVPGMSHALKGVGEDEEANYASFTDPKLPLAEGLVDLVAAFAKGEAVPAAPKPEPEADLVPGADAQGAEDPGEGIAR